MGRDTAATEAYDLSIVQPSRIGGWFRGAAVVVLNLLAQNMSADNGGGRRAVFTDNRTGSRHEFREGFGSNSTSTFTIVLSDYASMNADEFEQTWLKPPP